MRGASGNEDVKITEDMTFQIHCRSSIRNGGTRSEILKISVTPPPTITLKVLRGGGTGGDFYSVEWRATDALECTASGEGATRMGWTTGGKTQQPGGYVITDRLYKPQSVIDSVPGKDFTLTCKGVGGTSTKTETYSMNSYNGACYKGVYSKGQASWANPSGTDFGTWIVAKHKELGMESVSKSVYDTDFAVYKAGILAGKTDAEMKATLTATITGRLSGNWNYCD
jgi:hypothetical protein